MVYVYELNRPDMSGRSFQVGPGYLALQVPCGGPKRGSNARQKKATQLSAVTLRN